MKSLIPVVMAGIIAVYALVIAVLIANNMDPTKNYSLFSGFMHLGAGLSVGLSGMAAGYAIGVVGDMVSRGAMEPCARKRCPLPRRISHVLHAPNWG